MIGLTTESRNAMLGYDTPEAIAITDKAARDLLSNEKRLAEMPVIGEICPVGTLAKLRKMKALIEEFKELVAA